MSTLATTERVGNAWRLHRDGNNSDAISMFEEIIYATPENVDAHYGLGLAHKAVGNNAAAIDAFRLAQNYTSQALNATKTTSSVEGHHGANDLDTGNDDRFMMLTRMIAQRLEDVGANED